MSLDSLIIEKSLPPEVNMNGLTKKFGALTALDNVTMNIKPGSFHALLGENGAGKSTLVKCLMGYYHADGGTVTVGGSAVRVGDPRMANRMGLGMVYQHFTLVPSMTVAENLVLGENDLSQIINWSDKYDALQKLIDSTPFDLELDRPVASLAAGEKQKLEILKQLHLGARVLVLDEPTSVLTPAEADQILGHMQTLTQQKALSIVLISHKLREVDAFADEVTVLRHGKMVGNANTKDISRQDMIQMMIGQTSVSTLTARGKPAGKNTALQVNDLKVANDRGVNAVNGTNFRVAKGEIIGIAGVSGNGQKELVEALAGQRELTNGEIIVHGELFHHSREEMNRHKIFLLPEEPLTNACVRTMTVAENMAIRDFDRSDDGHRRLFVNRARMQIRAVDLIKRFKVKTQGPNVKIETLSGGNVQRAVLAREMSGDVSILIVQNPCFGLDLNATAEIRNRIMDARNLGVAVLLVSEDLDEVMELSDQILVMSEGRIVYKTTGKNADRHEIGRHMASH
jgi:ABC-type uncharacterized transport system ATPase subunit